MQVKLRALEPEDLDLLYCIENNVQLWGVGVTNVPYSRYVLHDYIANSSDDIYADRQLRLIVENEEGLAVGIADLVDFDPRHSRAELGIVIQPAYRGMGYGRAAVSQLLHYASSVLNLHQLYAIVDIENSISMRLFEALGFHSNAKLKEWLCVGRSFHDAVMMQKIL